MIQAVIFDLDGTILDNEKEWETAFEAVIHKHQIPNSKFQMPNGWIHEPGLGLSNNWKRIVREEPVEKYVMETVEEYKSLSKSLSLRDGVEELVQMVKEKGWRTGLCTGSTWSVVEKELEELSLELAFDVTTTGEEVLMSKPDPEIYLLTAQKLEAEPEDCLVIEDAIAGIRAAKEAGCKAVGLISEYSVKTTLLAAGADYVVEKISDISGVISNIG